MVVILRKRGVWLVVSTVLAAFVLSFLVLSHTEAQAKGAAIYHGPATAKEVAFACNVVWGTPYVLPLAKTFQKYGFKATFFLGGQWAQQNPEMAAELVKMGMGIGNHGYGHRHVAQLSLAQNESEIQKAQEAIQNGTGVKTHLYAPAYGELNQTVLRAADTLGYQVIMWSIDTIDWRKSHTPQIIESRVLNRLQPGAIILMHPTDRTLEALPKILEALKQRGYSAVTVDHLLGTKRQVVPTPAS